MLPSLKSQNSSSKCLRHVLSSPLSPHFFEKWNVQGYLPHFYRDSKILISLLPFLPNSTCCVLLFIVSITLTLISICFKISCILEFRQSLTFESLLKLNIAIKVVVIYIVQWIWRTNTSSIPLDTEDSCTSKNASFINLYTSENIDQHHSFIWISATMFGLLFLPCPRILLDCLFNT